MAGVGRMEEKMRRTQAALVAAGTLAVALAVVGAVALVVHGSAKAVQAERPCFLAVREAAYEPPVEEQEPEEPAWITEGWYEVREDFEEAHYEDTWEGDEWYAPAYGPQAWTSETGDLRTNGVESDGEFTYTWYSQSVLPGGALDIPGRHVGDGGYVMDGDGNICVASSDLPYGTQVDTPYGSAVVYDTGCASGVIDVYTDWK